MTSTCPSCNKFCSLEMQDPENNDLDCDFPETEAFEPAPDATEEDNQQAKDDHDQTEREGTITGEIRIVRTSECCGDDIKEATFEPEIAVKIKGHHGKGHEISVSEDNLESVEEGGGRYTKSYYGFELTASLSCSCGNDVEILEADWPFGDDTLTYTDKIAASYMDECN